jgi:hypothetical protein
MIWIIIGMIGGIIKTITEECFFWVEKVLLGFVNVLTGFMFGVLLLFTLGSLVGDFLPQVEEYKEQEIYALNDSSSTEGSKFLFSGHIDEKLVFRYVIETDKGKHIEEIKGIDKVYIKEGNYSPVLRIYSYDLKEDWHYWVAIPSFDKYYVFYVPENTVTDEYNINLN